MSSDVIFNWFLTELGSEVTGKTCSLRMALSLDWRLND